MSGTIAQKKACGNYFIQKYLVRIGLGYLIALQIEQPKLIAGFYMYFVKSL
jgi:hypothetical protein